MMERPGSGAVWAIKPVSKNRRRQRNWPQDLQVRNASMEWPVVKRIRALCPRKPPRYWARVGASTSPTVAGGVMQQQTAGPPAELEIEKGDCRPRQQDIAKRVIVTRWR